MPSRTWARLAREQIEGAGLDQAFERAAIEFARIHAPRKIAERGETGRLRLRISTRCPTMPWPTFLSAASE